MAPKNRTSGPTPVDAFKHDDKRVNIPNADDLTFVSEDIRAIRQVRYSRDESLDPQLVWKGKYPPAGAANDADPDLIVDVPPIYIQEKIDPRVIVENLRRTATRPEDEPELRLFETFDGLDVLDAVEYYQHAANWSNRMILGDSLQVMTSLLEREQLRGKVQMIYIDPPYGIKFGSNWQARVDRRDVKDGKIEDASREAEQIKAFRDTWELGIHTYLGYLRDRLIVARDLLTHSGSCFIQISDENVHLVRVLCDEVFRRENHVATIAWKKASPDTSTIRNAFNYVLWIAKDIEQLKARKLFRERRLSDGTTEDPKKLALSAVFPDGTDRTLTTEEKRGETGLPPDTRVYRSDKIVDLGTDSRVFELEVDGDLLSPPRGYQWRGTPEEMRRLVIAGRVRKTPDGVGYRLFLDDYPVVEITSLWEDTAGKTPDMIYVVQTNSKIIERCTIISTDPGDLVLDPTCGSGTTAYVAEEWGRRWITVDSSRVALALARQRLMGAMYPWYLLSDSPEGYALEETAAEGSLPHREFNADIRQGFVYQRAQHVTLKSIATNPDIAEGMSPDAMSAAITRHADFEVLYDKPYEDNNKVRVSGPFTVESLSPHRSLAFSAAIGDESLSESVAAKDGRAPSFEQTILDNLGVAGIQTGKKAGRIKFVSFETYAGEYIQAVGEPADGGDRETPGRIGLAIGPQYGTVSPSFVKAAASALAGNVRAFEMS